MNPKHLHDNFGDNGSAAASVHWSSSIMFLPEGKPTFTKMIRKIEKNINNYTGVFIFYLEHCSLATESD